jgi:RNA polymerase sigma-70 factor (ECF subfamily)
MNDEELAQRISRIETQWTLIRAAHTGQDEEARNALDALFKRYQRPVYAYLVKSLSSYDAADDVFQQFSLRLIQGGYRHADAARGKFRSYLKTSLARLIIDYRRSKAKLLQTELVDGSPAGDEARDSDATRWFDRQWREELLNTTWQALQVHEQRTGQPSYTLLRLRSQNPDLTSAQLAQQYADCSGQSDTPGSVGIRKTLQRAREKFADLLLEQVANSLNTQDFDQIETELVDLHLLPYCRSALRRRKKDGGTSS